MYVCMYVYVCMYMQGIYKIYLMYLNMYIIYACNVCMYRYCVYIYIYIYIHAIIYVCNTHMQFVVSQDPTLSYTRLLLERQTPDTGGAQSVLELEVRGPDPVACHYLSCA